MKKIKVLVVLFIIGIIGLVNVNAYTSTNTLNAGDSIYVDISNATSSWLNVPKIYLFEANGSNNNAWPGYVMTKVEGFDNIYKFTFDDSSASKYNMVIFNNDATPQTIDLSIIDKGLIYVVNDSPLLDGSSNHNNYSGVWRVYETDNLQNLVTEAKNYKESDYTYSTYSVLKEKIATAEEILTKNYQDPEMLLEAVPNTGDYTSGYEVAYNELEEAINSLVENKKIVIKDSIGGTTAASYKEKSDNEVAITPTSNQGYHLSSIKVTSIVGYDASSNPILGNDTLEYTIDDKESYEYILTDSDIYVEVQYEKNTYKINFTVGEGGNLLNDMGYDIIDSLEVLYGDDYILTIKPKEGYELDKFLIDGKEYDVTNNTFTIENISKSINVNVSFKIKTYNISVDGKNYEVKINATYDELLSMINIEKTGYVFKGLKDQNGDLLDSTYVVSADDELTAVYEKQVSNDNKNNISTNPNTGDIVLKYVGILSISIVVLVIMGIFGKKVVFKK